MLFIAFDQATSTTGYSIYKDYELITHGKYSVTGNDLQRYSAQKDKVAKIIRFAMSQFPHEPVTVALEDIQLQQNTVTFKQLAQLQGVLATMIIEDFPDARLEFVFASSWKSYAKIKGRGRTEQKRNAQKFVLETFNIKATQDEADAILIGYYTANKEVNWS